MKEHFAPKNVENEYLLAVKPIENAARRFHDLAISESAKLGNPGPAFGLLNQLSDVLEKPPHQFPRRVRLIERDVISDRIEITEGWLRPDQPSHRARRFLAAA